MRIFPLLVVAINVTGYLAIVLMSLHVSSLLHLHLHLSFSFHGLRIIKDDLDHVVFDVVLALAVFEIQAFIGTRHGFLAKVTWAVWVHWH